jgi:UDP-GlcNAc:undecaprenyl-phosphate GlcNAc-1-phosphate transferase
MKNNLIYIFFLYQIFLNIILVFHFNKISKIINLFDMPDNKRKFHIKKIPSIGGFLIFINIFSFFIYNLIKSTFFEFDLGFFDQQEYIIFIFFACLFFFLGILDDKIYLSANIKLLLYFLIILILILLSNGILINSINFTFFSYNLNIFYVSIFFTILCFLLFINAFNMYDGINLQSGLYSIFIFSVFLYKGIFIEISAMLIISLLFFLYLNFKNKCFLGNNGALIVSFVISYIFIKSNSSNILFFYADEIFLIMMIPGIDLLRLAIFRLVKGKHPFSADRNHLHHLLLNNFGFNKTIIILNLMTTIPYFIFIFFGHIIYLIIFSFLTYTYLIFKYSHKNLN